MEQFVKDYLKHIEMEGDYTSGYIACEVCGDKSFTVIRDIISIGKDTTGKLPVVACDTCGFSLSEPSLQ